jgi:hypothetical protein
MLTYKRIDHLNVIIANIAVSCGIILAHFIPCFEIYLLHSTYFTLLE